VKSSTTVDKQVVLSLGTLLGVVAVLSTFDIRLFAAVTVTVALAAWIAVVRYDHVTAFAVFFALMPLWVYLKFLGYPKIGVVGTQANASTIAKEIALIILFSHWLFTAIRKDQLRLPLPPGLLAFSPVVIVTLLVGSPSQFVLLLRHYVEMFVLIAVPLLAMDLSREDVHRIFLGLVTGGFLFSIIGLYHYFIDPTFLLEGSLQADLVKGTGGGAFLGPRLQSIAANPNNLGTIALYTAITAIGFLHKANSTYRRRVLAIVVFVSSAFVLVLTRSRDDIGLLAVGLILFLVLFRRRLPMIVGVCALAGGLAFNWDQILLVFNRLLNQGNPRIKIWFHAIETFGWQLLIGARDYLAYRQENGVDSTYLRLLIQTGALGLALFVLFNVKTTSRLFKNAFKSADYLQGLCGILLLVLLAGFTVQVTFFSFPFNAYYWITFALGCKLVLDVDSEGLNRSVPS